MLKPHLLDLSHTSSAAAILVTNSYISFNATSGSWKKGSWRYIVIISSWRTLLYWTRIHTVVLFITAWSCVSMRHTRFNIIFKKGRWQPSSSKVQHLKDFHSDWSKGMMHASISLSLSIIMLLNHHLQYDKFNRNVVSKHFNNYWISTTQCYNNNNDNAGDFDIVQYDTIYW